MGQPVIFFEVLGRDGDGLRSFYAELFGWKIEKSPGPMDYGMVSAGSAGLDGGVAAAADGWAPHVTIYVQTNDVQGALDRAGELGGNTIHPPMTLPSGGTIALMADPEGHAIGLVKPAS